MANAKGRGKGKKPDGTYWEEQTYYNQSSKSSGKGGFGRQQSPTGPDGKIMECWDCGSTQHLSDDPRCPNNGQGKGKGGYHVNPAVTGDWAQAEQPKGPQTGASAWHVAQPGGAGILEGADSVWVISENPFADAFPSSSNHDLHNEVVMLRQQLAITQCEVVGMRSSEEAHQIQTRHEHHRQIFEHLSAQATDRVEHHERAATTAATQARREARDTVACAGAETTRAMA